MEYIFRDSTNSHYEVGWGLDLVLHGMQKNMLFEKLVFHSAAKTSLFHAHDNPFDMFWLNGATSFQRLGTRKFQGVFRAAESFSLP